ncbi:MAG: hypothetical protein J5662_07710, partial [Clostridia bacterium]|nr:hypothetical protein [Clostridia bacterium]
LGIKNENWQSASRDLGAHALRLYLYLASNADGYTFALSPADIRQTIGMPNSTYRDQFLVLVDKGYLVQSGSNKYDFYEMPQTRHAPIQNDNCAALGIEFENSTADGLPQTKTVRDETSKDREINNIESEKNIPINIETLYPKRTIHITPPIAEGKKRPAEKMVVPKGEFVF